MELNKERKDFLLDQLYQYRYDKENNEKALKALREKLAELDAVFTENGNTLAYHSGRIKEENSTLNKINKRLDEQEKKEQEAKEKGLELPSKKSLTYDDLHDVVGVRLVCLSLTDVQKFVELIRNSDLIVVDEKDYIKNPKQSGYMSYHMIVEVPVDTPSGQKFVKCEIQLRTIFMDIFGREEHKLSYKGSATQEDKKELRELSDKLYFYDCALDNLFNVEVGKNENNEDLSSYMQEYDKIAYLYGYVYDRLKENVDKIVSGYENVGDVLHITSRIKPIPSIKRKMVKRHLECTAENMLYKVRDIVGFKIVCIDEATAKDFIKYFTEKIQDLENVTISNISDRMDQPKESGYRGYKMNLSYSLPTMTGNQSITIEILIRTMVMDAWALHDDKVFNNEKSYSTKEEYDNVERQLKGLSPALSDVEEKLENLKTNVSHKPARNLVKEVEEYQIEKKKRGLK